MKVDLVPAELGKKAVLNNLLEKYCYEFSQYDGFMYNEDGLFSYHHLDSYWTEDGRFPYLIYADGKLAGFVLICKHAECERPVDWTVAEFFVTYNFRRCGVGTEAMKQIFDRHKGCWHIRFHPKNEASVIFWNKVAEKFSCGAYETLRGAEEYDDGSESVVLVFTVSDKA